MRRIIVAVTAIAALVLGLIIAGGTNNSVEESGVTIGSVTQMRDASYAFQVMVYTGTGDIDELLAEERTLEDGPIPGLSYLLFNGLDCRTGDVGPEDLPPGSAFSVRRDPLVLFSSPGKLQAVSDVVVDC
jgi:hypothetical protein